MPNRAWPRSVGRLEDVEDVARALVMAGRVTEPPGEKLGEPLADADRAVEGLGGLEHVGHIVRIEDGDDPGGELVGEAPVGDDLAADLDIAAGARDEPVEARLPDPLGDHRRRPAGAEEDEVTGRSDRPDRLDVTRRDVAAQGVGAVDVDEHRTPSADGR